LTQGDLAKKSGVKHHTFTKIESDAVEIVADASATSFVQ